MRKKLLPLWWIRSGNAGCASFWWCSKSRYGEMTVMASGSDIAFERLAPGWKPLPEKFIASVQNRDWVRRKNYSPVVSGRTYCCRSRSEALAARAGIPLDVMYDVVTNAPEIHGCSKTGCVMWWMAITPAFSRRYFC